MTKKHYIAIARIINLCVRDKETRDWLAAELERVFREDNPRFDAIAWHEALA